ncbi:DUF4190 domain-containing protein [Arthrobacter sp.]|uniref:DUF4190 domain-containing protein n=1 Tax=Arthrobacter sp. TaxID=1667 RepID=UPI003A8E71E6
MIILLMIAVVVAVVVLVIALATRSKGTAGVDPYGRPVSPQSAAPPTQIGYTMDGQPLYQQRARPGTNVLAVLALVLSFFVGILGIVFGHISRAQIRRTGEGGAGLALAGLIIGYVWVGLFVLRMVAF